MAAVRKLMCERVHDKDSVFRHVIFPVAFDKKRKMERRAAFGLRSRNGYLVTSVAWEKYVPTADMMHEAGCERAAKRNSAADQPLPTDKVSVYCGAYRLMVGDIRSIPDPATMPEIREIDVRHTIEDGDISHANLIVVPKPGSEILPGTKTAIIDRLWKASGTTGPMKHICKCDEALGNNHPSSRLLDAPSGPYADARPWHVRAFMVTVCWLRRIRLRRTAA